MATAVADRVVTVDLGVEGAEGLAALTRGLRAELALLGEVRSRLLEQRAALAADDTVGLEQVVQQIGRTLLTIREARRQRGVLMEMITGQSDTTLLAVADHLSPDDASPFRALCRELHAGAVQANRELLINQSALKRALESGERFLQQLLTVPDGVDGHPHVASGLLLNQRA